MLLQEDGLADLVGTKRWEEEAKGPAVLINLLGEGRDEVCAEAGRGGIT